MKQRYYIDTSVVGGYFDKEFEKATKMFFKRFEDDEIIFVVSDLLDFELLNAPKLVKELLDKYDSKNIEYLSLNNEAIELANKYIEEKVVGQTSLIDCRHIALATIYKVDVLVSWNFKHIVNLERIHGYNAINMKNGYTILEIRNPKDLISYEK
jgi:predicted nucleic acid-binding protein